jgi:hypothetical protein
MSEERLDWSDITRHASQLGTVEDGGDSWLGLRVRLRDERIVRMRIEALLLGRVLHLGAVVGGRPANRVALTDVLSWNATLPPGATVILHDGALWLRFLVPLARLSPQSLTRLVAFVAREGARWVVAERSVVENAAYASVFFGFAE